MYEIIHDNKSNCNLYLFTLPKQADAFYEAGRFAEALALLDRLCLVYPKNKTLVNARAKIHVRQGKPHVNAGWGKSSSLTPGSERKFAGMTFCWIPPGDFMMGSPENEKERVDFEGLRHRVTISKGFWLGKYPVTQDEWETVIGNNPSEYKGDGRRSVENVYWYDCQGFIQQLNAESEDSFRLPSEAEWEYACRAGTTTRFYWGGDLNESNIKDYAWHCDNCGGVTSPVGQKRPNAWGLHDMSGNVKEWCEDDWHDSYAGAPTDGRAWVDSPRGSDRLSRGGSWWNSQRGCRSAQRYRYTPDDWNYGRIGFRLALPAVQ